MDNDFTMGFFSSLCFRFSGTAQGEGPLVGEGEVMSGFMMEFLPMFFDVFLLGCFVWLYFRLVECVKLIDKAQKRAEDDLSVWSEDFSLQCNRLDGLLRMNKSKLDELSGKLDDLKQQYISIDAEMDARKIAANDFAVLVESQLASSDEEILKIKNMIGDDRVFVFDNAQKLIDGLGLLKNQMDELEEKVDSLSEHKVAESKGLSVEEQFGNLMSFQAYGSNK